eukprot:TRINITY_DN6799_c0_g1_i6.p1 TRINITY_DN6799_c0_g1~~TRINITY_DN6799_c0_g1_i6.p1  ORF type:complete len:636 (+),score=174.55 TRINITY_DN6799_c0_g1_i6:382-2289(+)
MRGIPTVLQINPQTNTVTAYLPGVTIGLPTNVGVTTGSMGMGQRTDYPFSSILRLEKSNESYRLLYIFHRSSSLPEMFLFPSCVIREQFTRILQYHVPRLGPGHSSGLDADLTEAKDTPENGAVPNVRAGTVRSEEHVIMDSLRLFIGSWNMSGVMPSAAEISAWIPTGRDLYVIGAQRVGYKPPAGFVMQAPEHWFLVMRQYLPDHMALATTISEHTATIVLVRRTLVNKINNLVTTVVKQRSKTLAPDPHVREPKVPTGGLARLREARDKLRDQIKDAARDASSKSKERLGKEKDMVYGTAVYFQYVETSFCFINYLFDAHTINTNEDYQMYLKTPVDLHHDFHHVFLLGDLDQRSIQRPRWVLLVCSDAKGGGDSVLWRARQDASLPSNIAVGCKDYAPEGSSNPVFAQFDIPIYTPPSPLYPVLPPNHLVTFTATNLSATDLRPRSAAAKPDAYVTIHGPFLLTAAKSNVKKSSSPVWSEPLHMQSFITDQGHLQNLFLRVEIWDKDMIDDTLVCKGIIPLTDMTFGKPMTFRVPLMLQDESAGTLLGEVLVTAPAPVEPESPARDSPSTISRVAHGTVIGNSPGSSRWEKTIPSEAPRTVPHDTRESARAQAGHIPRRWGQCGRHHHQSP